MAKIESNELSLYYQLQFSLEEDRTIGAEALLRWNNLALGAVSPAEFVPTAEFGGQIVEDQEDKSIVTAIISMAGSLNMKTIAEGVERAEQLAVLRANGCSEAQGYYFEKPLPADAFGAYLLSHQ